MYQFFHSGEGKIVTFTPHGVEVWFFFEPHSIFSQGIVDHSSRLYQFEGFDETSSIGIGLVSHVDSKSKLWHERFGHLKYIYLKELSTHGTVDGLPRVSCLEGVFLCYALEK